jgi:catechol 2,3-dioxygenase-like lactoylglutathione lyase family enzyme
MRRIVWALVLSLIILGTSSHTVAQLLNKQAAVIIGHYHLNVTSVDAHKKFWVDTLGGTMTKIGNTDVVRFPDIFLFLQVQKPTGPTKGTGLDHIGFAVPDVPALTTKVVANGYELTTGREPAPGEKVALPTAGNYGRFSYLLGPDGAKVELVTNMTPNAPPIVHHHVHFINKQYVEMQQWYMKAFNATLRPGQTDFFIGADLPGVGYMLNFFRWEGDQSVTHMPTAGRVYDHVGFEVRALEEFCKQLEAKGIKLAKPYRKDPAMNNMGTAMVVDPWGVSIELTEGLRDVS